MLSERSQAQKTIYCLIPLTSNAQHRQIHGDIKEGIWGCQGLRKEKSSVCNRHKVLFRVMKMFWNQIVVIFTQSCEQTKTTELHALNMEFIECELYLIKKKFNIRIY